MPKEMLLTTFSSGSDLCIWWLLLLAVCNLYATYQLFSWVAPIPHGLGLKMYNDEFRQRSRNVTLNMTKSGVRT